MVVISILSPEQEPMWLKPPIVQFLFILAFSSAIAAFILFEKVEVLPFEKKNFLKTLDAYECIARFVRRSDSPLQDESDIKEAEKLLKAVSSAFVEREGKDRYFDIVREINNRYIKLGKLIQTKILFYCKRKKDLGLIKEKILELADTLAEVSSEKLDSCINSLESIPETGPFKPSPTFLESHSRLQSFISHGSRLLFSFILVLVIAVILSFAFSRPISEFATYVLASTFVLFAAWEFKSK